jgi:hypothetical protein
VRWPWVWAPSITAHQSRYHVGSELAAGLDLRMVRRMLQAVLSRGLTAVRAPGSGGATVGASAAMSARQSDCSAFSISCGAAQVTDQAQARHCWIIRALDGPEILVR